MESQYNELVRNIKDDVNLIDKYKLNKFAEKKVEKKKSDLGNQSRHTPLLSICEELEKSQSNKQEIISFKGIFPEGFKLIQNGL